MKSHQRTYRRRYALRHSTPLTLTTYFLPRLATSASPIIDRRVRAPCPAAEGTSWWRYLRRLARSGNTAGPRSGLSSRLFLGRTPCALLGPHPILACLRGWVSLLGSVWWLFCCQIAQAKTRYKMSWEDIVGGIYDGVKLLFRIVLT